LTYLQNHQDKMDYASYRRDGLPITSSHVESTVKLIGRRVKGTEKFWSEEGAEARAYASNVHYINAFGQHLFEEIG
jgi:hypothetical protein